MKIITAVVNNPEFIEIQYHTLKQYYQGNYEFIVFNDAKRFPDYTNGDDVTLAQQIEEKCRMLQIKCISIPNEQHQTQTCAAVRCADSMNFMFRYQLEHPDQYLVIDSDMFLIHEWSASKWDKYDAAIVLQSRDIYHYPWNGIYYFDMFKLKNRELMCWDPIPGCDVGGGAHEWLQQQMCGAAMPDMNMIRWTDQIYNTDRILFIKHLWSCTWDTYDAPQYIKEHSTLLKFLKDDVRNVEGKFFCELYDNAFLHYRAGGNWRKEGLAFHQDTAQKLKQTLI